MFYSPLCVLLVVGLASAASIPKPESDSTEDTETAAPKQKRGIYGGLYSPSVVAHAPLVAPAPVYHAPIVAPAPVYHAPAPVYHAPLVAHAPAATSYSSISIAHTVPKLALAHAPVYHAPVYAAHAPLITAHAPAIHY